MTIHNRDSKIYLGLLLMTSLVVVLIFIPRVFAMNIEGTVGLTTYRLLAFFAAMGGAIVRFAQRRFAEFKRFCDIVLSLVFLVTTLPVILISGVLIKVFSPDGPIFYTQKRVGKGSKIFDVIKLRTMIPDAEKESGAVWANEDDDPRCIRFVGKLLRNLHVDEIPQFINVLKGEMSIIGPRPERPEIVRDLRKNVPEYEKRLQIKPGITGLAQIRHKYDQTLADVRRKVKLDLVYIRKMCLFVDLGIIFKTIIVVFKRQALG